MEGELPDAQENLRLERLALRIRAIGFAKLFCLQSQRRVHILRSLWEQCVEWFENELLDFEENEHLRNVVVEDLPYLIPRN